MADTRTAPDAELADAANILGSKPSTRLTPEMEQQIEQARQLNLVVAAIAGCSWGANMSPIMRRAFADYCRRYDVDPVTEMDNLGGSPYINAEWYMRKLGELRIRGVVSDYFIQHIHADERLEKIFKDESVPEEMRKTAREAWFSMLMKRIAQNAPEEAEACCICTIILPTGTPIIGCKWAGNGTSVKQPRHQGTAQPNPIAEMNPALFVETSSIRRAARQLFSHLSGQRLMLMPDPEQMTEEIDELRGKVQENIRESMDAGAPSAPMTPPIMAGYDEAEAVATANEQNAHTKQRMLGAARVEMPGGDISRRVDRPTLQRIAVQLENAVDPYDGERVVALDDRPLASAPPNPAPTDPTAPTPFDLDLSAPVTLAHHELFSKSLNVTKGQTLRFDGDTVFLVNADGTIADEATVTIVDRSIAEPLTLTSEDGENRTRVPPLFTFSDLREEPPPHFPAKKPLQRCLACEEMVSGPYTAEHKASCLFHLSNKGR